MIGSKHLQQYDIIDPNHLPRLVSFTQVDPTKVLNLHIHAYKLLSHWVMTGPKKGRFRADYKLALRVVLSIWERRPVLCRKFNCEKLEFCPSWAFEISNLCIFQANMLSKSPCQVCFSLICLLYFKERPRTAVLSGRVYFSPIFILYTFISLLLIYGGLGGLGFWGLVLDFWGWDH